MSEKRLFLAVALSLVTVVAWQYLFPPPVVDKATTEQNIVVEGEGEGEGLPEAELSEKVIPSVADTTQDPRLEALPPIEENQEKEVVVPVGKARYVFSNKGATLRSLTLDGYEEAGTGQLVELVTQREGSPWPFALVNSLGEETLGGVNWKVEKQVRAEGTEVTFRYRGPQGEGTKTFLIHPEDPTELKIEGVDETGRPLSVVLGPGILQPVEGKKKMRANRPSAVYRASGELEKLYGDKAKEASEVTGGGLEWVGLQDTYFASIFIPDIPLDKVSFDPMVREPSTEGHFSYHPLKEGEKVKKEKTKEYLLLLHPTADGVQGLLLMGPKEYDHLKSVGYSLEKLIDWGYFTFISRPLLWLLLWIHTNVVQNYGWAIVLMTILLKLILLPLTIKSHKSMKVMQTLNPKVQAIRKKYKGKMRDKKGRYNSDSQKKMNEEMQALYKAEGVNPAGGCFPMLVQLPVFFGFYRLLSTTIQIKGAPWFAHLASWSWIADLSAPDPLYILPLVMGGSQLLQQKQAPMSGDATQRAMMKAMPIAFTFFALTFPSGLVLYWLTNNILHIVQVGIYNKIAGQSS